MATSPWKLLQQNLAEVRVSLYIVLVFCFLLFSIDSFSSKRSGLLETSTCQPSALLAQPVDGGRQPWLVPVLLEGGVLDEAPRWP